MPDDYHQSVTADSIERRQLLRILGVAGAGALAGCSGDGDGGDGGSNGDGGDGGSDGGSDGGGGGTPSGDPLASERIGYESAENSMNYWTQEDFIHTAENTNLGAVHEELLTTWAEEHPDWQINVQIQTNLEQFKTQLLQANAGGNAPPMSECDSLWVPQF